MIRNNSLYIALYRRNNFVVQWSENVMPNVFAMKSAIKERHHSKYHHQMVFHITAPWNILTDMIRIPLGTLGIKFRDSKMFIRRNSLNRLGLRAINFNIQSTLVISKSKGPAETLRDIRTSTYQMCTIEENTKQTTTFHK